MILGCYVHSYLMSTKQRIDAMYDDCVCQKFACSGNHFRHVSALLVGSEERYYNLWERDWK